MISAGTSNLSLPIENPPLIDSDQRTPNERWEQEALINLKQVSIVNASTITLYGLTALSFLGIWIAGIILCRKECKEDDHVYCKIDPWGTAGILYRLGWVWLFVIPAAIAGVTRQITYWKFTRSLCEPGTVRRIRSQLLKNQGPPTDASNEINTNGLLIGRAYHFHKNNIFCLKDAGILTPKDADKLEILFKRSVKLFRNIEKINKSDESQPLIIQGQNLETEIEEFNQEWIEFQNHLANNIPYPTEITEV